MFGLFGRAGTLEKAAGPRACAGEPDSHNPHPAQLAVSRRGSRRRRRDPRSNAHARVVAGDLCAAIVRLIAGDARECLIGYFRYAAGNAKCRSGVLGLRGFSTSENKGCCDDCRKYVGPHDTPFYLIGKFRQSHQGYNNYLKRLAYFPKIFKVDGVLACRYAGIGAPDRAGCGHVSLVVADLRYCSTDSFRSVRAYIAGSNHSGYG